MTEKEQKEVEADMANAAYHAVVGIFEREECAGHIVGNGHHVAQAVAQVAVKELHRRWRINDEGIEEIRRRLTSGT